VFCNGVLHHTNDLETGLNNFKNSNVIWGEDEIRLLIKK